jgi:hypothetical protein
VIFILSCRFLFYYCFPQATLKENEVAEDAPIGTAPGVHPKEAVDAQVVEIMKEKQFSSDGFDGIGDVRDRASDDIEEGE